MYTVYTKSLTETSRLASAYTTLTLHIQNAKWFMSGFKEYAGGVINYKDSSHNSRRYRILFNCSVSLCIRGAEPEPHYARARAKEVCIILFIVEGAVKV